MATPLWTILIVMFATVIGALGALLFKKASSTISISPRKLFHNHYLREGILMYAISTVIFIPALKAGELSVLYPFVALTYVWVSLLSIKYLGEKMNKMKWFGILFILIGVSLIGIGA